MQLIYRCRIHVIIMIMTDQDQVNIWKLTYLAWNFSESFWTNKLKWRASIWKYWVYHYVHFPSNANYRCRMANPSVPDFINLTFELRVFIYRQFSVQFLQVFWDSFVLIFWSPFQKSPHCCTKSFRDKAFPYLLESRLEFWG